MKKVIDWYQHCTINESVRNINKSTSKYENFFVVDKFSQENIIDG